jgi:hypothetical protein
MTSFPTRLLAGTTITVSLRNSPAKAYSNLDGWGLVLFLQNIKGSLNLPLVWDADHWVLNVGASDLNALTDTGEITTRYQVVATKDEDSLVIEGGRLILARSLNTLTGGLDARTHEERVLDNIRAVIEKSATKEQHKYMVNGMELERRTLKELVDLEKFYASRVAMQNRKAQGKSPFETIVVGYN